jgi:ATP-dependent Clp protease ATP-binding subunit ClpA
MNNQIPMSDEMNDVVEQCSLDCIEAQVGEITKEHILYRLLENQRIMDIIMGLGLDLQKIHLNLSNQIRSIPQSVLSYEDQLVPPFSGRMLRMLNIVYQQNEKANKKEATCVDFLNAFINYPETECFAYQILYQSGLRKDVLHSFLVNQRNERIEKSLATKDTIVNLNELARKGKIDEVIGRVNEIERVIQVLSRRKKNNPILVGEPGVGKTAIAEGLALRIVKGEVPDVIKNAVVLSLDLGLLIAGTKFRGDFEEKMNQMLRGLKKIPNAILFIDEIHTIIGAGAVGQGALDAANILKPLLARGEIKCMGSTTYSEYRNVFEKDAAMARRFQKIDVVESTIEETVQILKKLQPSLEIHHRVFYTADSLRAAAELSAKHINDRYLPDKAIDILDEAGAAKKIHGDGRKIDTAFIEKIVAKVARIPEKSVSKEKKNKIKDLANQLKSKIFGQDQAVDSVVSAIELASSGLRTGEKPIGSFLFCGPTGVGKTELCKQLSDKLGVPFIRFDMSEYSEEHTISRLIGAPPGYIGHENEGLLTGAARKNPHSLILMDEIEKSHPKIWNVLLQIMDHGTLTDSQGKKSDFKNCIIVMTSNVGAQDMNKRSLGLNAQESMTAKPLKAVEQTFSPEFRNRLDEVVFFNGLTRENISFVLEKNIKELNSQLQPKGVSLEVDMTATEWLIENGYNPLMGARPMARLVQDKIKRILAPEMLHGKLEHGGKVKVSANNNALVFDYDSGVQNGLKRQRSKKIKEKNETAMV